MDMQKFYKFLRYALQFIIVYLVLRYTPQINLDTSKALIISLLMITLCVVLEFLYNKVITINTDTEPDCDTCKIPQQNTTCHVVCDKVENFADTTTTTGPAGTNEVLYAAQHSNTVIPQIVQGPKQETITQILHESHNPNVEKVLHNPSPPTIELQPSMKMHPMHEMRPLVEPEMHTKPTMPTQEGMSTHAARSDYPTAGTTMDITPFYLAGNNKNNAKTEKVYVDYNKEREAAVEQSSKDLGRMEHPYQIPGKKSQTNVAMNYDPKNDGNIINEMDYSDYDYNSLPLARGYVHSDNDYGYNFIPPTQWYNSPVRAPVCVTTVREPVYPMLANGSPTDVKDFYIASKVTGPLNLSIAYAQDKMNSGR